MTEYTDINGTKYTEADIERWAIEAEAGFKDWEFGERVMGRPISVGADAKPFTIRLDAVRRAKVTALAKKLGITPSHLVRNMIDAL